MKKLIVGAAVSIAGLAALRGLGPSLHQRAMDKCKEMDSRMPQGLPANQTTGDSPDTWTGLPCDPTTCHPDAHGEPSTLGTAS